MTDGADVFEGANSNERELAKMLGDDHPVCDKFYGVIEPQILAFFIALCSTETLDARFGVGLGVDFDSAGDRYQEDNECQQGKYLLSGVHFIYKFKCYYSFLF